MLGAPTREDIRLQLARVIESAAFRGSLRLPSFLAFVVETTLAGRSKTIKAYTIGVEALRRRTDFDPQANPIVRVEAGRLRHALARYYAGEGRDDPVVIELLRGSYVPRFSRRGSATADDDAAPSTMQTVLARLDTLRRQLTLAEAELRSAAMLLERSDPAR